MSNEQKMYNTEEVSLMMTEVFSASAMSLQKLDVYVIKLLTLSSQLENFLLTSLAEDTSMSNELLEQYHKSQADIRQSIIEAITDEVEELEIASAITESPFAEVH